jgi:hypothetical protein
MYVTSYLEMLFIVDFSTTLVVLVSVYAPVVSMPQPMVGPKVVLAGNKNSPSYPVRMDSRRAIFPTLS